MAVLLSMAALAVGPGLKLGPPNADGTAVVHALDHQGRVVARVTCIQNEWVNSEDAAARLMSSTAVAAIVLAKDGRLETLEDLGPSRFDCVLLPPTPGTRAR